MKKLFFTLLLGAVIFNLSSCEDDIGQKDSNKDCIVSDYEGTFTMNCSDNNGQKFTDIVAIISTEDEDGQFYEIAGLPDCQLSVNGYFDATYHFMHIKPAQIVGPAIKYEGIPCLPMLVTLDINGSVSTTALLTFVCNANGTLTLHESSKAIGFMNVAFDPVNQSILGSLNEGYFKPEFTPIATKPAEKVATKK